MGDQEELTRYVDTWRRACGDFVALAGSLAEDEAGRPTDLPGWSVKDVVAHTAHLEAVLAGGADETVEVPPSPHVRGAMGHYTEQGVLARRDRSLARLVEEIERAVAIRDEQLRREPPTDGSATPPRSFRGADWDVRTLLRNRPLDVWMHEQDIRRAIGRPGGYDAPGAAHTIGYLAAALPVVVGKRVAPPAGTGVRLSVPEATVDLTVEVGEDGRARPVDRPDPDVRITLTAEAFVVLAGGRRRPADGTVDIEGDRALAGEVMAAMAVTP